MSTILIPPGVCGRVRGSVTITVDEVFWSGTPQSAVYVKFSWWGSEESYTFYPNDLTKVGGKSVRKATASCQNDDRPTSYTFQIGTSMKFLEEYFKKWKSISFYVYRTSDKRLLGTAEVENWECILSDSRYGSYFSICDKKGNRIGDLHIVFSLKMKKTKKKYKLKSDFPIIRDLPSENAETWSSKAGENELLTDLLSKGQQLRKAMVKSVLSSCDTRDLDEVVSSDAPPPPNFDEKQSEAKLVDFLMGKELTEPEKEIAMKTLRCTSPAESILEVATTFADRPISREAPKSHHVPEESETNQKKFCSVGDRNIGTQQENETNATSERSVSHRGIVSGSHHREAVDHRSSNFGVDDGLLDKISYQPPPPQKIDEASVNSYRVTFGVMTLTAVGLKKVSTSPTIKPLNNKIRPAKSPGIVFSIETVMPFAPKCKAAFLKPVTLSSKAFGGNDVIFNESVTQKIRRNRDNAWSKVGECIAAWPIKIYWRCLNQRLPSLLGQSMLPDELASEDFELICHLPVYMANKQVAAVLSCKVELGVSGVFGNDLLGDEKHRRKRRMESMLPQLSEVPPSRQSIGSVKSVKSSSQDNSKESCSFQISQPPPARCRTASSAASTAFREPVENDQHLMNAIANLNDKLTKRIALDLGNGDQPDVSRSKPPSANTDPPKDEDTRAPSIQEVPAAPELGSKEGGNSNKSGRGCCCCCRGCPGDCKRKKSLRKKPSRDRHIPSNRGAQARKNDSSALSNTDEDMSPEARAGLSNLSYGHRFHSPPTKLNTKSRHNVQATKSKEFASSFSKRLDHLYSPPLDYADRPQNVPSEFAPEDRNKFLDSHSDIPSVHRFNVNVYSSDAHIFYREGELELFMVYRFPQVDPVSGKLFCPAELSSIELSGDGAPITHYLPLRVPLSEALLAYPKHNITFHIWARAYLYEKRDFLIGQAKLPLEKLVEWEAAHVYSQKRRVDHPLLPPDKHFINLRIHPSKGELPQHLEPGRIAQLGLEIDYEKFRDIGNNSFDAWPLNSSNSPSKAYYPTSHVRDEVTDSSDPYLNFSKRDCGQDPDPAPWRPEDNCRFNGQQPGKWGVRVLDSFSDPNLPTMRLDERNKSCRQDVSKEPTYRSARNGVDIRDDEEFMLILGDRNEQPVSHSTFGNHIGLPPERLGPEGDKVDGLWSDDNLQFQSFSRGDMGKKSDFVPVAENQARFLSPRIDRDFPSGVKTADFSSDNNSLKEMNPFEVPVTVHPQPKHKPPQDTRICADAMQSSPLPSLARVIDPNYRPQADKSPVNNLDSSFDLGSDSKATQTTVNEQNAIDLFSARVEVEAAINLLPLVKNGKPLKPSSRIEFDAWSKGKQIIIQSAVVPNDSNPKYESAWNVELPAHLLYKGESEFELRVVNVDDGSVSSAFIDLTTLSAGLPCIEGWYFLSSNGHKSAGQVKVSITPTENIRKYRDEWIEECRKTKAGSLRRNDRISCESAQKMMLNDTSSSKFKEKMKELEQLTERMKQKLLNVDRWDASPPCTLMRDVDNFAKQLIAETDTGNSTPQQPQPTPPEQFGSSVRHDLPELDMKTVQEFCPIDSEVPDFPHRSDSSPLRSYHSRIRAPKSFSSRPSRLINNRVNFLDFDRFDELSPVLGSKSPINLISFDDSPDADGRRSNTYSLPSNSNDTSPTSPVVVPVRGDDGDKFDSDDSSGLCRQISLDKCHEELERLPRDSLDAASLAIEKMIADLRNQKVDDSNS